VAELQIPGTNRTIGIGVTTPHVSINFPIPGCNPNPPTYNPGNPPQGYKKISDYFFSGCACSLAVFAVFTYTYDAEGQTVSVSISDDFGSYVQAVYATVNEVFEISQIGQDGASGNVGRIGNSVVFYGDVASSTTFFTDPKTKRESKSLVSGYAEILPDGTKDDYEQNANAQGLVWILNAGVYKALATNDSCPALPPPVTPNSPPPPNPPPQKPPMGDCCQAIGRQNDDLKKAQDQQNQDLAELKKQVQAIYNVLNPKEFEQGKTTMPKRLMYPEASGQQTITDYHGYFEGIIRQIDRAVGYLPTIVKVADANPEKGIGKPIEIKIQSISDALKVLVENMIETEADAETLLNMNIRQAFSLKQITQTVAKNYHMLDNIEHWLDYKVKNKTINVPVPFNPAVNPNDGKSFLPGSKSYVDQLNRSATRKLLSSLLQEGNLQVQITEMDDEKLLAEWLAELNRAAMACMASLTHEHKDKNSLYNFLDALVSTKHLADFAQRENVRAVLEVGDLETYQTDLGDGYVYSAQAPDVNQDKKHPYNRPPAERPNVQTVSKKRKRSSKGRKP
jgi:hypothetical protein